MELKTWYFLKKTKNNIIIEVIKMHGLFTPVSKLRRNLFKTVAKMAYTIDDSVTLNMEYFDKNPIIKKRLKFALGLSDEDNLAPSDTVSEEKLVAVIEEACKACSHNRYFVTDGCMNCFAHPCVGVCPTNAVSIFDNKSHIDYEKCVRCGKCAASCPYKAIMKQEKPCASACGVNAIKEQENGKAYIDYNNCVSCGLCMAACPFAAIFDKTEIYQVVRSIRAGEKVCVALAPSFVGQFGKNISSGMIVDAIKELGFYDVFEVAIGADVGSFSEAVHFMNHVPEHIPFMATSCCPSWAVMAKRDFPELAKCVLDSSTPMVETGKIIKMRYEDAVVVFVGPCVAKKSEAKRDKVKPYIDYVLTFEELCAMFEACNVEFDSDINEEFENDFATSYGKGYASTGGVLKAITSCLDTFYGVSNVKTDKADGLINCRKMLSEAKAGKKNGYLLEGMACPGGCVGGPGALVPIVRANAELKKYVEDSKNQKIIDVFNNLNFQS